MDLFLARFTLSDEEANALSSSAKTVPPKPGASSNLPALLSLEWNDHRLDIMAVTASHSKGPTISWSDGAEFRSMGRDALFEVSTQLSESARRLRLRAWRLLLGAHLESRNFPPLTWLALLPMRASPRA